MGTDTSLACGVHVPRDPPTTVKWYKSEFPQNDTSTLISDNTDGYELRSQLATTPVPSGNFSGLFYDQYILVITNFTASDTGYYWCQIETNSTEDSLTLQPSQYGYRAPNPGQSQCISGLQYFDLLDPETCAVAAIISSTTVIHSPFTPVTLTPSTYSIPEQTMQSIYSQASKSQVVTILNPTSTVLPPSSDDSGLPTTVYIAVGAGGGGVVVITCIGVSIVMTICVRSRSITKREEGRETNPYTGGLWVHLFTV